ncbi:unnamed protein product [Psylliodes chrysocephalus]|uniref:Uncharacterized protein n=1 Tax=Psylliodes chrysocephalus TaxID=3402493 RepID=A0A9P0CQS1_9CUCU|nr:unnamed protein product [Psylliodes chrysocephala]
MSSFCYQENTPNMWSRCSNYCLLCSISSHLTYGTICWDNAADTHISRVFILQKSAIRAITLASWQASCRPVFPELKIMTLYAVIIYQNLLFVRNNINTFFSHSDIHNYNTRHKDNLVPIQYRLERTKKYYIELYNILPLNFTNQPIDKFKHALKQMLSNNCLYSLEEFKSIQMEDGGCHCGL